MQENLQWLEMWKDHGEIINKFRNFLSSEHLLSDLFKLRVLICCKKLQIGEVL